MSALAARPRAAGDRFALLIGDHVFEPAVLPLVVVLAAIGSNTYWISLVLKLRHLLGDDTEAVAA